MNRSKGILPIVASALIVAVVFLVIILAVPLYRGTLYWTAVAFGGIAIVVALLANLYVVLSSRSTKSALYRISVSTVGIVYMVVACAVSFIFMLMPMAPLWILIVVQVILLALCLAGVIAGGSAANTIERGEEATSIATSTIATLRAQADSLKSFAQDPPTRQALKKVADELRFADPISSPATAPCDQQLLAYISQLASALQAGDTNQVQYICSQMSVVIAQRAAFCRDAK